MNTVLVYAKALVGFAAPMAGSLIVAVQDSSPGGSAITQGEWIAGFCVAIVTAGAVGGTPNKDREGTHQRESVQPPGA
jgi:hypothetical protein